MDQNNATVREQVGTLTGRITVLNAALDTATTPIHAAIEAVEAVRDGLLEQLGGEMVGTCEICGAVLLTGDQGFRYADSPDFCEEHSPSWADARADALEALAVDDGEDQDEDVQASVKAFLAEYDTYVSAGGNPDERYTITL